MTKILFLLLLMSSCAPEPHRERFLDRNRFMEVYVALASTDPADTTRPRSRVAGDVFRGHGTTEEEFRATVGYYNTHPELWKEFLDEVILHLEKPAGVAPDSARKGT